MPGSTRYYGFGYFDFGDPLNTDWSAQIEISRWVSVDKLIYGLMSLFGNGVVSGWEVAAEENFTLSVSEGYGNINFMAGRTEFPFTIENIPPNSITYVFVRVKERTRFAEDVDFFLSPTRDLTDPRYLLLAEITTGSNSIELVDNSVRQDISFIEIIKAAVKAHRHRGGSQNPSKIDLTSEVKGQLPSFRIADFDAEKITTGTFDLARMPLLDHQDLANIGLLTHPQLDTFVKSIESSNKEIFGEIMNANFLQFILASKLIYDDPDSPQYVSDRTYDKYMINEISVIPGITPDKFIDFSNSTAQIDLEQHVIYGNAPTTGTMFYVNYDTALAWNSSYSRENVVTVGDSVTLAFNDDDDINTVTVEDFESAANPEQLLSGTADGGQELFKKETVIKSDNAKITASSVETNVIEGFYSGKFRHQESFRVQFKKEFSDTKDWSSYDSFVLHIKCLDSIHGAVKLFLYDADGNKSPEFVVLEEDEVTSSSNPIDNSYETRVISLSQISFRTSVKGFVIFSDDTETPFSFYIDFINIQRSELLPENGTIVLRYSSANAVTFQQIEWNSTLPSDTEIKIRARSANGTAYLTRADFTPYLNNGDLLSLKGSDLEIEITLYPDDERAVGPTLNSLRILILTQAEIDGFIINDFQEFDRGTYSNLTRDALTADLTNITISDNIVVGSYYFCLSNSVQQIYEQTENDGNTFISSELALFANKSPIAPNQIFAAIEAGGNRVNLSALFEPKSVIRKSGKTFIVADTFNDRVLEFNEDGDLISGFGSINYEHESKTFPLGASVDLRTGILYIVWSKKIPFKSVNVNKIVLQTTTRQITLVENFDKILGLTKSELEATDISSQILPIYLAAQNVAILEHFEPTNGYCFVSEDSIGTGLDASSVYYSAISSALGIPLFVGNFAYIDGVFCPTFANKTDKNTWLVANASIGVSDFNIPDNLRDEKISISSKSSAIIEVDENNSVIFGTDKMFFSPFVPGGIKTLSDKLLLVGGIKTTGSAGTISDGDLDFRSIFGDTAEKTRRKEVLNTLFFGNTDTPYQGAVIVLDKKSGATIFQYSSPEGLVVSDVDIDQVDGSYVVAETSFRKSGRIIKLDTAGNVIFTYGEGVFSIINDVATQPDGSFVVST